MMQYYLVHARHGKKIAHQDKEAEADKKNGWKEVTEDEFFNRKKEPEKAVKIESVKEGQDPDLIAQFEALKGKKPHHRMSNESIREALNDTAA